MLEMGFRGSHIAGTSDAKGPHGLGEGALNPRSLGILRFVGFSLLMLPCGLQAEMLLVWSHGNGSPRGTCTIDAPGARLAITLREFNLDDRIVPLINDRTPAATPLPHRTQRLLLLPVNHKAAGIESLSRPRLPSVIGSCRTEQLHAMLLFARHQ